MQVLFDFWYAKSAFKTPRHDCEKRGRYTALSTRPRIVCHLHVLPKTSLSMTTPTTRSITRPSELEKQHIHTGRTKLPITNNNIAKGALPSDKSDPMAVIKANLRRPQKGINTRLGRVQSDNHQIARLPNDAPSVIARLLYVLDWGLWFPAIHTSLRIILSSPAPSLPLITLHRLATTLSSYFFYIL